MTEHPCVPVVDSAVKLSELFRNLSILGCVGNYPHPALVALLPCWVVALVRRRARKMRLMLWWYWCCVCAVHPTHLGPIDVIAVLQK
ncbi:hypothetical protein F5Y10DRAFT_250781 [Nemania abortiva]|nr:hypothetical protein F5Y10DRAFT_250781 [Nemania abortiva]